MSSPHRSNGSTQNGVEQENFTKFFESWLSQQDLDLHDLLSAASAAAEEEFAEAEEEEEEERRLRPLIDRVIGNYENYYRVKSAWAKRDVLPMFTPKWTSSTENLFLWIGGWRPTMAIQLLYSKSGLQLESRLDALIRGAPVGDLAGLSHSQLERIDRLQRRTIQMEREITEEKARNQEALVSPNIVDLSHVITEIKNQNGDCDGEMEMMEPEIKGRREGMKRVLERADELRLETLKGVVGILRPLQAVHFLIAAAELHLRVHEFGKRKDEAAVETESS